MDAAEEGAMNLNNNKGAMTIVFLVMLSSVFVVMMGVAGVKLLEAAKNVKKHNEAYNYLLVMEELGQAVSRSRSLGRDVDCRVPYVAGVTGCPAGTVRRTLNTGVATTVCSNTLAVNHYTLCVPDRNVNGAVDAVEYCARIDGFNYCLSGGTFPQNLQRLDLTAENPANPRPPAYTEVAGASTQQTNGGTLLPRSNREVWTPAAVWANNNEIFTTNCGAYPANSDQYWLGCHYSADPRLEIWMMQMCPRSTGIPAAGPCPGNEPPAIQRIVLYFENNRPQ